MVPGCRRALGPGVCADSLARGVWELVASGLGFAMSLLSLLILVFVLSGVTMLVTALAHVFAPRNRIYDDVGRKLRGSKLWTRVFGNMLFSSALVFAMVYALHGWLFTKEPTSVLTATWHVVAIMLLYDFLYYLMHRFAFHEFTALKRVHAVHHAVRHPTAPDSLYLHPLETFLGLALLIVCTWILGPVGFGTFAIVFGIYSLLNILVHAGVAFDVLGLRALGYMAIKHDKHHNSMRGGNFASITPIWDRLFGTAE